MAHRTVLTARQRAALFDLATDQASLLKHYTLSDDDIRHIRTRRRPENQIGFALQLCAFRYPGRLLKPGEVIPDEVARFLAAQLGLKPDDLLPYAAREKTRREHLGSLRKIYGYKMFNGKRVKQMRSWLDQHAEDAQSSEGMVRGFVEECRRRQIILPGLTVIERHCADALVAAERRIDTRIAARLDSAMRRCLDDLLHEEMDNRTSRFVWLRQFEVGKNSADINRQLDRLEFLQGIVLAPMVLDDIPAHRVARLRRQGERYFTDGLRDITSDRRLAILAVCVVEWAAAVADTVVETHDRIVGAIWRDAKKICDTRVAEAQVEIEATLAGFETLGSTLLMAKGDEAALAGAVDASCGWGGLESLVVKSGQLRATVKADVLAHVAKGFHRFKLYARRMLSALDITCADVAQPLLKAAEVIREKRDIPTGSLSFLPPRSKWRGHFRDPEADRERLWVVAVLFHLRDTFRSGDIWLTHSRRYADMKQALVPIETARAMGLIMPLDPETWIEDRKRRLEDGLKRLATAARTGTLPGGVIEDGTLRVERLDADVPEEASDLVLDLYRRLPEARITDILMEVDDATGFTEAFTHLHTGAPCRDKVGLLNVVLAEGLNLGLSKMAGATSTHDFMQLSYHRAECLTHVGDSQAVRSLTQCGEPMRFAMAAPIDLRNDFDSVSLRRLAKRTRDATQSRRLLALAEVYDGGSRTDASRIGGVGLQIIRDWVLRFNARGPDGLVDGKSPGAPSKLNADHRRALAEVVEAGPVPAVDGVVRWRRKDLARWLLETFAISLDETTVGRELKALGFAKISARPRHYAQNELAVEAFKKNFPAELAKIRARLPKGVEIELWWQDEARIGQKNKLTRRWARRGTRPRAPRDQRTEWAYIFGAICPAKGKGTGLVMPWCDTDAMAAHLIEISAAVDPGAHAVLIVDQAGWHLTPKLAIPDNITVLALPPRSPELNPVENVWQFMRDNWLSNRIFKSYEDIVALCCQAWNNLIDQPWKIMSLGMRKWAHGF